MRTTSIIGVVGDPQAADEVDSIPSAAGELADLRSAAVDHDRAQAHEVQQGDVGRERPLELLVDHGVAAVLDHDGLAVEARDPRQGLAQHRGLVLGCGLTWGELLVGVGGGHRHVV